MERRGRETQLRSELGLEGSTRLAGRQARGQRRLCWGTRAERCGRCTAKKVRATRRAGGVRRRRTPAAAASSGHGTAVVRRMPSGWEMRVARWPLLRLLCRRCSARRGREVSVCAERTAVQGDRRGQTASFEENASVPSSGGRRRGSACFSPWQAHRSGRRVGSRRAAAVRRSGRRGRHRSGLRDQRELKEDCAPS